MISPVPKEQRPQEGDFKAPEWDSEGANDATNYFDTYLTFERHATVVTPDAIASAKDAVQDTSKWIVLERNDDSSEMPANPGGRNYNSLLRVTDETKLLRGLYRIGFTTYKRGEVKGSFLAQVGAPVKLPGVAIAKTLDDLAAQVSQ